MGSEMCIRDRSGTYRSRRWRALAGARPEKSSASLSRIGLRPERSEQLNRFFPPQACRKPRTMLSCSGLPNIITGARTGLKSAPQKFQRERRLKHVHAIPLRARSERWSQKTRAINTPQRKNAGFANPRSTKRSPTRFRRVILLHQIPIRTIIQPLSMRLQLVPIQNGRTRTDGLARDPWLRLEARCPTLEAPALSSPHGRWPLPRCRR